MFQKGHGRKNFVAIKTDRGYYSAYVAGGESFTPDAAEARLFEKAESATAYYQLSLQRVKRFYSSRSLPLEFTIEKVKLTHGTDQNN